MESHDSTDQGFGDLWWI